MYVFGRNLTSIVIIIKKPRMLKYSHSIIFSQINKNFGRIRRSKFYGSIHPNNCLVFLQYFDFVELGKGEGGRGKREEGRGKGSD